MPTDAITRKAQYQQKRTTGLCPRCGVKTKGFIYCEACRAYFRNYNKEKSEKVNEARKIKYLQRKNNRQCPRCGVKLRKKSKNIICTACLEKQYSYTTK